MLTSAIGQMANRAGQHYGCILKKIREIRGTTCIEGAQMIYGKAPEAFTPE